MAHLTENFTFEGTLSPRVREAISAALDQGWAEPKKLSQASHRALELRSSAIEEIANLVGLSPLKIEVSGEPDLLHFLALQGYLSDVSHLYTSSIDVGKIRAVARAHTGPVTQMGLSPDGLLAPPRTFSDSALVSLQAENGETGIRQDMGSWRDLPATVILDATRTIPVAGLVEGFSAATLDAQSWGGPAGLGFLAINDVESYRYPLPHIAPIRVPGSFSLPLLVGAAIALNEYVAQKDGIENLRNELAERLRGVSGLTVIGDTRVASRYLSILVDDVSGEEVLRSLLKDGISTDSGSACSPEDLTPSHVIAALGFPTAGHLRFTIHAEMNQAGIERVVEKLTSVLINLRS